jgi:hypothetical protein
MGIGEGYRGFARELLWIAGGVGGVMLKSVLGNINV